MIESEGIRMATERISCRIDSNKLDRLRTVHPGISMTTIISNLIDGSFIEDNRNPIEADSRRTTPAALPDSQSATLADKPTEVKVIPPVKEDRYLQAWRYMNSIKP